MLSQNYVNYTVSQSTLRTDDLIEAIHNFSEQLSDDPNGIRLLAQDGLDALARKDEETAMFILNEELFDAMNEIAPEGTMFSSHPGDGSLFGFWPVDWMD